MFNFYKEQVRQIIERNALIINMHKSSHYIKTLKIELKNVGFASLAYSLY